MSDWLIVLLKTATMFAIIVAGWAARRGGLWPAGTTPVISRIVVDIAFPGLVVTQMLRTVTAEVLLRNWYAPLLGAAIMLLGALAAAPFAPLVRDARRRHTFVFLCSICNWIYLPLPIVESLHGSEGVLVVLLANVGAQLYLWSAGIWILQPGGSILAALRNLIVNRGLLATAAGLGLALLCPGLRPAAPGTPLSAPAAAWAAAFDAMSLVGGLTIPLSLLATGAQLGDLSGRDQRPGTALWGILGIRLLLVPAIALALGAAAGAAGWEIPLVPRRVAYLICAMPVAITCSLFSERYGGDTALGAKAIFYSTLAAIATVPAFSYVLQRLGL